MTTVNAVTVLMKAKTTPAKQHTSFQGLPIVIENPVGSIRHWRDASGRTGQTVMTHTYGYVEGTCSPEGAHEGIDVFLGPHEEASHAYIIHQLASPDFEEWDEDKVMLGFVTPGQAKSAYLSHYDTPRFFGSMTAMSIEQFKEKVYTVPPSVMKAIAVSHDGSEIVVWIKTAATGSKPPLYAGHDGVLKALLGVFAKAAQPCERWITVHPHGPGSEGVPVCVRESKTHRGTFHVTGGAGGKLNYLKLTHIKTPAEHKADLERKAQESAQKRKETAAKDRADGTQNTRASALRHLKNEKERRERQLIDHVAQTMAWKDYDLPEDKMTNLTDRAKEEALRRHHRGLLRDAKVVIRQTRERLLADSEARAQAKLGTLSIHGQSSDALGATDILPDPTGRKNGYRAQLGEKAEAAGLTPDELEAERSALRTPQSQRALEERQQRKELVDQELDGKDLKTGPRAVSQVDPSRAASLLAIEKQLRTELKDIHKKTRALREGDLPIHKAYDLTVAPVSHGDIIKQLEASAEDRERIGHATNFLRKVEDPSFPGQTAEEHGRSLDEHLEQGASNSFVRAVHSLTGQDVLPRHLVTVLGTAGTAQVLARAIHQSHTPDQVEKMVAALGQFHGSHHQTETLEAMRQADEHYQAAREIEDGTIEHPEDLAVAAELNARRLEHLNEAKRILGQTLGEQEATAALQVALQSQPAHEIRVALDPSVDSATAIRQARAIGLDRDDYEIQPIGNQRVLVIRESGLDKLLKPVDPADMEARKMTQEIIEGKHDEEGWLPHGFASRPLNTFTDPEIEATRFAQPFRVEHGQSLDNAILNYVGSQTADGVPARETYKSLFSNEILDQLNPDQHNDYFQAVDRLFPLTDDKGKPRQAESHRETFERAAEQHVRETYGTDAAPLHAQSIDIDHQHTAEALHRAMAVDPRRTVALKQLGDLTRQDQDVLRGVFEERFGNSEKDEAVKEKLDNLGAEPERESEGLFGPQENPLWREWKTERDAIVAEHNSNGLNWDKYVALHHGRQRAYAAMQDILKGETLKDFADHYGKLTKQPLKVGRAPLRGNLSHLDAIDPEARERRLAEQRELTDALRNRTQGKYAAGSVKDKFERARQLAAIADENQRSMFGASLDDDPQEQKKDLEKDERYTLGSRVEQQLAALSPQITRNFDPKRPVKLKPDLRMDGKYAMQQRAIRLIEQNKRMALGLGVGSGKTNVGLGAFTHLHEQGKVKRGLFAVPSIVQAQFGSESAGVLKPGKYSWWNDTGASRQERLAAYRNPDHHFAVVTHQALRDDLVHLMAQHWGVSTDEATTRFNEMPEQERGQELKKVLDHEGINFDYLMADESHDALNRAGKENSSLANVLDALSSQTPYYVASSADPVKNDLSELWDQLHKIDPDKYTDRNDWLAKYKVDTNASRDALKQELSRYLYAGRVSPGVEARKRDVKVSLTPYQRAEYAAVQDAYERARVSGMDGRVDMEAIKRLSPGSFEGKSNDEQMSIADRLSQNLGILRDTALDRAINHAPAQHNAKIHEVLRKVKMYSMDKKPGIIFAHSREAVASLTKALEESGHKVISLTGSDTAKQKADKIHKFQSEKADVLVMSDAGAVGANVQRGKYVIHYDIPHTAKTWEQRTGRIHRLGQTEDVDVDTLMTDTPLDFAKRKRLETKGGLRQFLTSPYEAMDDHSLAALYAALNADQEESYEHAA